MDFLSIPENFVESIAGKDAVKLLGLLKERENISEFKLAEDLKININQVRNLLYKLNAYNFVYSTRRKDKDKGLYIYYWTFNFKHARDVLTTRKNHELGNLQEELKKENEQRYYACKNGDIRVELEEAMELGFKCPECGSLLQQEDSTKKIGEINHKITTLNEELEELRKPVSIIPKPEEEVKVRKARKKKIKKAKKKVKRAKKIKKAKKTKKTKPRKIKKRVKQKKSSKKRPKLLKRLRKFRF